MNNIFLRAKFRNAADDNNTLIIDIDGVVGALSIDWSDFTVDDSNTVKAVKKKLREFNGNKIIVNINSPGGDLSEGISIMDALAEHSAEVETRVNGLTASAATVIAQAGDRRLISSNAMYLIHRAWTIGIGGANDFLALAEDLEKIDGMIAEVYVKRSGQPKKDILELMNARNGDGKWLNAKETVELGLMDESYEPFDNNGAENNTKLDLTSVAPTAFEGMLTMADELGISVRNTGFENTQDIAVEVSEKKRQSEAIKNRNKRLVEVYKAKIERV